MTSLKELDVQKLSTLLLPHVDQATCMECCKFYMVPTTAPCGHTLCHGCWLGRKKCATCGAAVDRRSLKLNLQLQKITEHTHNLRELYEKIFNIELDDLSFDTLEKESTKDTSKNVRDWLANSENQFSAPDASQQSTKDLKNGQKQINCDVQIHNEVPKTNSTKQHLGIPQDDWDKIEEMPDTEELLPKNKNNPIGPMDIEPLVVDQFEFTPDNPRRSSRKRESKDDTSINTGINSMDKNSTKVFSKFENQSDSKVLKDKQKWSNVNRMRKEFSKLNKQRKNKLNVSIEMCKKSKYPVKKKLLIATTDPSQNLLSNIDENTPNIKNTRECVDSTINMGIDKLPKSHDIKDVCDQAKIDCNTQDQQIIDKANCLRNQVIEKNETPNIKNTQPAPVTFLMKGTLQAPSIEDNYNCCDNNNINNPQSIIVNADNATKSSDDIEITIKIGNTLTNIYIKKKLKDVQYKIHADREIQTTFDKCVGDCIKNASSSPIKEVNPENNAIINSQYNKHNISQHSNKLQNTPLHVIKQMFSTNKPSSSKKNTESADTATVQYEITESIEKELSKEMDKEGMQRNVNHILSENIDEDCLNDLELFDNDSMKEVHVQSLKSSNHPPSEILISTMKSKKQDKRSRDLLTDNLPISKKRKITQEDKVISNTNNTNTSMKSKKMDDDSEIQHYDVVMGQVFANIDLELEKKSDKENFRDPQFFQSTNDKIITSPNPNATPNLLNSLQGQSENVFSLLEKENNSSHLENRNNQSQCENQPLSELCQPNLNNEAPATNTGSSVELIDPELSTPAQNKDDESDESIVEETPQKNTSFHKIKQKSGGSLRTENSIKNKSLKLKQTEFVNAQSKSTHTPNNMVINLSDTTDVAERNSKHVTVLEAPKSRPTLDTPLTISKFVDQIKHKSTPMAKKSLNFDNANSEQADADPDQTLCPNSFLIAKTTQEREFMTKAFEDQRRARSSQAMGSPSVRTMKYCLAGSCLTPSEVTNVKLLCSLRNWNYLDKYTNDLTHLVVGVDDEKKSQRSVKYMCALASSKWIVSYEWVQKCLHLKKVVDEEPYEALDGTGDPGPRRSRLAKLKLFEGITFFCMEPFSVLDLDTLKTILEAAGGRVVGEARAVRVTSSSPTLLLAEPEHTQEDRFIYLAMELSIVPVNYEWVLNCLGSYALCSLQELLLCPASLLPPATAHWPPALMAKEYD